MNINAVLERLVVANDYDVIRDVPDVPVGATLSDGWLTIKKKLEDADAAAAIRKHITPILLTNVGQITDTGGSGTGTILFQLVASDTATLLANRTYFYDITVKTSTGKTYTVETGRVKPLARVRLTEYS